MIDLERTRPELLALIDAREDIDWMTLDDPTDTRFLSADHVRLHVEGHSRDGIFPVLNLALTNRLHHLEHSVRVRDVLAQQAGDLDIAVFFWEKLVERGVEKTNGYRLAVHRAKDTEEILTLHRLNFL